VIRIWHEAIDRDGNFVIWRGSIDHVGTGRRLYFNDLSGVVRFIRDEIGSNVGRSGRWISRVLDWIKHEAD
jgi:hypothetical protein